MPTHFLARRKIRKTEGESPQRSVQPPVSRNVFFSVSAHQVPQVKGAYLTSLPCSLANCFALCAWISSQMAAYDLSEGCSPITQTQTSLSAPSFHFTDFPLAGREVALSQTLFAQRSVQGLCPTCCVPRLLPLAEPFQKWLDMGKAGTQDAPPISFLNTAAGSVKGTFLNVGTRDANISFLSLILCHRPPQAP